MRAERDKNICQCMMSDAGKDPALFFSFTQAHIHTVKEAHRLKDVLNNEKESREQIRGKRSISVCSF